MSKEQLDRIDEILSHVRSIDAQMTWVIRSEGEELEKLLLEYACMHNLPRTSR